MVQHPDLPVRSRLAGLTVRGFRARVQARASALPRNTGRANSLFHRYGWRSSNETAGASRMSRIVMSDGRILYAVAGVIYASLHEAVEAWRGICEG